MFSRFPLAGIDFVRPEGGVEVGGGQPFTPHVHFPRPAAPRGGGPVTNIARFALKLGGAAASSLEAMVQSAASKTEQYAPDKDSDVAQAWEAPAHRGESHLFDKGQSKRIWGELYKVLDSSKIVRRYLSSRRFPVHSHTLLFAFSPPEVCYGYVANKSILHNDPTPTSTLP